MKPPGCVCPAENYTCEVSTGIKIRWESSTLTQEYDIEGTAEDYVVKGGFQVHFRKEGVNLTSTLHVNDLDFNGTNLTCDGIDFLGMGEFKTVEETITVCVVGKRYKSLVVCV